MAIVYFPSCRFTSFSPNSSKMVTDYLSKRFGIKKEGCCRLRHQVLSADDTAVYICNTCGAICRESSPAKKVLSVWELIAADEQFIYPNYRGEKITVQDCWHTKKEKTQQEAVRCILRKMNFELDEQENNYEKTNFCGVTLLSLPREENTRLAPKHFVENAKGLFLAHSEQEQEKLMQKHCKNIQTNLVACYCRPCVQGINLGGKKGVHLLDLLFEQATV